MISVISLKKNHMSRKITTIAIGALIAICLNISTPKVSSATGQTGDVVRLVAEIRQPRPWIGARPIFFVET